MSWMSRAANAEVHEVEALPHFGADSVAHLAGVLPALGEAVPDGIGVYAVEGEVAREGVGIGEGVFVALAEDVQAAGRHSVEGGVQPTPADVYVSRGAVNEGFGLEAQETAEKFRPLKIAAHPV